GHVVYGYGIPARLARRLPDVVQRTVLLNPGPGLERAADHIWR
ncbi:MAG: ChaN family lipoprotein, partial [Synechococcaceae cyanobacterium SM2_3_60]|nr:ChaN family lipoprotein [Synechococcaceae cyanobacterium SM2_3_60]